MERWNRLHPGEPARTPHILRALGGAAGPIVAASDYMKVVADQLAPWLPGRMETLGTDGFGRSDNREYLRRHFEVNAESIAAAALSRLARDGQFDAARADRRLRRTGGRYGRRRPGNGVAHAIRPTRRRRRDGGERALAAIKIAAGLAGHSTAVVADGLESAGDVFASGWCCWG